MNISKILLVFSLLLAISMTATAKDIYVTSVADSGPGTLREAVANAENGDLIRFEAELDRSPIYLETQINIEKKVLTIVGNGVGKTVISGNQKTRVLYVGDESSVFMSGVSIIDGYADNYAGILLWRSDFEISDFLIENNHAYSSSGGGVSARTYSKLVMRDGVIAGNTANRFAGGFFVHYSWIDMRNVIVRDNYIVSRRGGGAGGGAELDRSLGTIISNSSFVNNSCLAPNGNGGGFSDYNPSQFGGRTHLMQSTVSKNTALGTGGGIHQNGAAIVANGLTITHNAAVLGGGYSSKGGENGNIFLKNSVLAGNAGSSSAIDFYTEHSVISNGFNLIGADPGNHFTQRSTDNEGEDPKLQDLQYSLQGTPFHPLLAESVAINAGEVGNLLPDQRGKLIHDGMRDIGAYESNPMVVYADKDGDGFGDPNEPMFGTDKVEGFVTNALDNCPYVYNRRQSDRDGDGIGDSCDPITDEATDNFELNIDCDAVVEGQFEIIDTSGLSFASYLGDTLDSPLVSEDHYNRIVYTIDNVVEGKYAFVASFFVPSNKRRRFSLWFKVNDEAWVSWSENHSGRSWTDHMYGVPGEFILGAGKNTIQLAYRHPSVAAVGSLAGAILDRPPVRRFRTCRDRGYPEAPIPAPAPSSTHYLATQCATVGSSFTTETAPTGETYAVYKGQPTYSNPPSDVADNRLTYVVPNAVAGSYNIFARIDAPSGSADSYWVRVNGGSWLKWASDLQTPNGFDWRKVMGTAFDLVDGRNTIDFAYREPNVKLEKVYVTTSSSAPPNVSGGSEYACDEGGGNDSGGGDDGSGDGDGPSEPTYVSTFSLNPDCATVGDKFVTGTSNGVAYVVYTGSPSMTDPPADQVSNRVRFTVDNAVAGDYHLFAYVDAPTKQADSYWVRINDGEWVKWFDGITTDGSFTWRKVAGAPFSLRQGSNTIDFAYREANIKLAQIHLDQSSTLPSGFSSDDSSCSGGSGDSGGGDDDGNGGGDAPSDPTYASAFALNPDCASVGDKFTTGSAGGVAYVVYTGSPSMDAAPTDQASNRVRFSVDNAAAGDYHLFAYVDAPTKQADSYWVRINDGEWVKWFDGITTNGSFAWRKVAGAPFALRQGSNTIDFAYREADIKLAQIQLKQSTSLPTTFSTDDSSCSGGTGGGPSEPTTSSSFWLEGECAAVGSSFITYFDNQASAGEFVVYNGSKSTANPPADAAQNYVRFTVDNAVGGEYRLFTRLSGGSASEDSFWVRYNGGAWQPWLFGGTQGQLEWKEFVSTLQLSAGSNTIDFAYREPNSRLDKIYLAIDGQQPSGVASPASNCN